MDRSSLETGGWSAVAKAVSVAWALWAYVFALLGTPAQAMLLAAVMLTASWRFAVALALLATGFTAGAPLSLNVPFMRPPAPAFLLCAMAIAVAFGWLGCLAGPLPSPSRAGLSSWLRTSLERTAADWRGVFAVLGMAPLAALLFRKAPVAAMVCYGALFSLLYCAGTAAAIRLPRTDAKAPWRQTLGNACLLGLSVVFALLLLEGGARLVLPLDPPPGDVYEPHREYIFLLNPGGRGEWPLVTSPGKRRTVSIEISPQGLRDRAYGTKAGDEFRILMLGDSHTMGHAVFDGHTIPRQLERMLEGEALSKRVTVINAGCSAAGPLQELGMLRERGLCLEPDLAILQLFPQNDIDNSLEALHKQQRAYNVRWHRSLREWRMLGLAPYRAERWARRHSRLYRAAALTADDRNLIVEFLKNLRPSLEFEAPPLPPSENRLFFLEPDLREWYPELEEGMALMEGYVLEIREECRGLGVDFAAYCMPDINNVDEAVYNYWIEQCGDFYKYEHCKALRKAEEFLRREGIAGFSVLDTLRAHPLIDEVYLRHDGHLRKLGNKIVADRIRDFLMEEYFPGKGIASPLERRGAV